MNTFPCYQCGACCRHVNQSPLTRFLDRGDGCCKHYDEASHLCGIYTDRPQVCRVDHFYEQHYREQMDWAQFVALNLTACSALLAAEQPPIAQLSPVLKRPVK